ncbi:DISP complex protein LRCH3 isoform X4 [Corvus hawaiiensis]|uniref:Leucine rich repeats and calponin homology domain containing 3 n=1 Tax=Corvus moneduloides TaxID=1196302 RepID=A0A8C3EDJ7_CORMO|nr:DISP complex protein LRCH3 isoform X4 [Corvus moneduloides]XP_041898614.1 DISP complex protein LRCH3 isoform X5 [Corvus kubaryi]XP_048170998.1 DISP complex protein LRCH3 isoform X4 [Corvus hawaiiensis]
MAAPEGGCAVMPAACPAPPGPSAPGSWSRSLDRALEEAAVSGTLSLSGRKLRDYPRASAANHDLSDTTQADLSRNRLSELPAEACHFVSLETLNLYQNCIRYIPEAVLNLQSLTFLNISRNQLSILPVHLCSLPLKVLIASNNKLVSIPEEIGRLRQLTELDVSCNELQTIPPQIGNLESLRDLNVRRNNLVRLPEELAELPLIRLDFSCNKITTIPVCYRNLRHLQTIMLENNPLQSPPAQICIKGKIHIFKYLNIEACKIAPDLPDYDRRPMGFVSCHEELYSSRPYGALDSGFNSVDSGDKRWSGNEPTDEFSDLPLRVAEITKEQRLRRESQYQENRGSAVVTNGGVEHDLDQIDYIDSCATEEEEEEVRQPKCLDSDSLSSQFMAYIDQRRISNESSPAKPVSIREFQRTEDTRRHLHQNRDTDELRRPETLNLMQDREHHQVLRSYVDRTERPLPDSPYFLSLSSHQTQVPNTDSELHRRHIERTRREAQLAALQYEEERMRTKQIQREAVLDFVKQKASLSPQKQSPMDSECPFPSRRSQHTDDSALLVSLSGLNQESCATTLPSASTFSPVKSDDRSTISPGSPTAQTVHLSPPYPGHAAPPSYRNPSQRPESFLFRTAVRDEAKKAVASSSTCALSPANDSADPRVRQNSKQREEELELIEQLRKNIESRLKVSLPSDLGAALTDGVVLCHLANHVRPRSVPSIHVPSPAVPRLTMAKCRRNVENFLEACRRIGVPQDNLCSPSDILQLNLSVKRTVETLLSLGTDSEESSLVSLSVQLWGFVVFYCTLMLTLCMFYRWVFFL